MYMYPIVMSFRTILGYTPTKKFYVISLRRFKFFGARHICGNLKAISFLLKFKTLDDVENYTKEVYMLSQNFQVLAYQMQYINIEVKTTDISLIMNSVKKSKKRAQKSVVLLFLALRNMKI